mgnify:CR=1 FL=1|jgi:hypothetical protein
MRRKLSLAFTIFIGAISVILALIFAAIRSGLVQ